MWIANGEYLCPGTKSSRSYEGFLIEQSIMWTCSSRRCLTKHSKSRNGRKINKEMRIKLSSAIKEWFKGELEERM